LDRVVGFVRFLTHRQQVTWEQAIDQSDLLNDLRIYGFTDCLDCNS
jgi:hypothetical protein